MTEKVFELPFDRENFITGHKTPWIIAYKKRFKHFPIFAGMSIIILILGILFRQEDENHISLCIGGMLVFYCIATWSLFAEKRAAAYKKIVLLADDFEKEKMDCTYVFSDHGIEYRDKEKQLKVQWGSIKRYDTFNGFLFIYAKGSISATFYLSEEEIGVEEFKLLHLLLNDKISVPGKKLVVNTRL